MLKATVVGTNVGGDKWQETPLRRRVEVNKTSDNSKTRATMTRGRSTIGSSHGLDQTSRHDGFDLGLVQLEKYVDRTSWLGPKQISILDSIDW